MKFFVPIALAFAGELPVDERSNAPSYLNLFANGVQVQKLSVKSTHVAGATPICFAVNSFPDASTSFVPAGNLLVVTTYKSNDCSGNGKASTGGFPTYRKEVFKGSFEVAGARSIKLQTLPKYSE